MNLLDITPLDLCLWVWIKSEVYRRQADIQDELRADIFDADTSMKKREDQLRRATRYLCTRAAKWIEGCDGISGHLLRTVTNLSFKR
jgi:hypothetical protein